jgi:hypothetical protein
MLEVSRRAWKKWWGWWGGGGWWGGYLWFFYLDLDSQVHSESTDIWKQGKSFIARPTGPGPQCRPTGPGPQCRPTAPGPGLHMALSHGFTYWCSIKTLPIGYRHFKMILRAATPTTCSPAPCPPTSPPPPRWSLSNGQCP